jgi:hypothetical protein
LEFKKTINQYINSAWTWTKNVIADVKGVFYTPTETYAAFREGGFGAAIRLNNSGKLDPRQFMALVPVTIAILIVIILYTIVPNVGVLVDKSFNVSKDGTAWADAPSGAGLWTDTGAPMINIMVTILFIGALISVLVGLYGGQYSLRGSRS